MNLKEARENKKLTQEQLAEKVGVIRQTISNIETGVALPSLPIARSICSVLGCTWDIFFNE